MIEKGKKYSSQILHLRTKTVYALLRCMSAILVVSGLSKVHENYKSTEKIITLLFVSYTPDFQNKISFQNKYFS